jgi:hypothetical protein
MLRRLVISAAVLGLLAAPGTAHADVLIYGDRGAWEAAVGAPSFFVDFSTFAQDVSFGGQAVDAGPFLLLGFPRPPEFTSPTYRIDVPPLSFPFSEFPPEFGARVIVGYNDIPGIPDHAEMLFDVPLTAWGADLWTSTVVDDVLGVDLYAEDGSLLTTLQPLPQGGLVFFAFETTAGERVQKLVFRSLGGPAGELAGDAVEIDNVAGVVAAPVPEPSTLLLTSGAGMALLGRRARHRRNRRGMPQAATPRR